jgi:hypothetical protein
VAYYGTRAIEIGPDENMHDSMVEEIARLSVKRGYILGIGIISSKRVGINHKEYGVTSTGVVKFAEITMGELGVDIRRDPFTVKFTGGPQGDVAGNAMRILLDWCPQARIGLILDGTAALVDPGGADGNELRRLLLRHDLDAFDPARLHPGGFILHRNRRRSEGLRELYLKAVRTEAGVHEEWVSLDEFSRGITTSSSPSGRPLHPCRGEAGDGRSAQLAPVLPGGWHPVGTGHRRGSQLLHCSRSAHPAAEARDGHHARRLRQQVRRHLLLLRNHRQSPPYG